MTDRTTARPFDLDAIRRCAYAATDGPWWAWDRNVGFIIALGTPADIDAHGRPLAELPDGMRTDIGRQEDAEFIAAARQNVPLLLGVVNALIHQLDLVDQVPWRHECGNIASFERQAPPTDGSCDACESGSENVSDWRQITMAGVR